jgi:hypothetical protein
MKRGMKHKEGMGRGEAILGTEKYGKAGLRTHVFSQKWNFEV